MRSRAALTTKVVAPLLAIGLLAGCGDDEKKDEGSSTDPITVTKGEAFTWNDYAVEKGWTIKEESIQRGGEDGKTAVINGVVTNESDEARVTLFSVNFVKDDELLTSVYCTSPKLKPGDSTPIQCASMAANFPSDYDELTVSEVKRD